MTTADRLAIQINGKAMAILGRQVHYEEMLLDIFNVDYYYENPRINYIITRITRQDGSEVTSDLIEKELLNLEATKDLIQDIEANGGLHEPILVSEGRALEGNTRLSAYRKIYRKTNDPKWRQIPAKVITDSISSKEVFIILSNYHIKGKKPWDAFEKAACIKRMIEQGYQAQEVAKLLRTSKLKVETVLKAHEAMLKHYLPKVENDDTVAGAQENLKKYSYYEALFDDKKLASRAQKTPGFLTEFTDWILEGRVKRAQDVRDLEAILSTQKARKEFTKGNPDLAFKDALFILHKEKPEHGNAFYKALSELTRQIEQANVAEIKEDISSNSNKKYHIQNCFKEFRRLCIDLGLKP